MNRKAKALLPISIICIACIAIPVSAFYFDFQYFETDKLVYEVGETIGMVTKLIADFSNDGWCYVSFAVVTDLGPSFADEYFISPSPLVRYFNSSYTILPEHTSPGITGVLAFALFTVEIFDTVSQSAGDNIEVTINRGHLITIPLTSLSVEYGLNTSIPLKIASIHNDNVVYSNESVVLHVEDSNSQTVLESNKTTTSEGIAYLNWSKTLGPPGIYNLTVSSYGNEDFLSFSNSFEVTVFPASSNLSIVSSPESVFCQSPDASYIEQAEITVEHRDLLSSPINDSSVYWTSSFGSGTFTNLGNGQYSNTVPFNTSPGTYQINITATNSQYQAAEASVIVNVLANSLVFSTTSFSMDVTRGNNATIDFSIDSYLDWNQSIQLRFIDESFQFSHFIDVQINDPSSMIIPIWHNISIGQHIVDIFPDSEYYEFSINPNINLTVIGIIDADVDVDTSYYGESLEFNLTLLDDNNQTVSSVNLSVFCDYIATPFAITGSIIANITQTVFLPMWISPGIHNITFVITSPYYLATNYSTTVRVWMRTNLSIVISNANELVIPSTIEETQGFLIVRSSSSGSIIRPPPILFKETTSTIPLTTLLTSLDNWPRLSSGTNRLSTDLANSLIASSGNGHTVLNLKERIVGSSVVSINSSIDLDVEP